MSEYDSAVSEVPALHAALAASHASLLASHQHADAAALALKLAADRCRPHPTDPTVDAHDITSRQHARAAAAMRFDVARAALTNAAAVHQANEVALAQHLNSLPRMREKAA